LTVLLNIGNLENPIRLQTVGNFEVCGIVLGNCATKLALFIEAETNARRMHVVMSPRSGRRSIPPLRSAQIGSTWVMLNKRGSIRLRILNAISFAEKVNTATLQFMSDHVQSIQPEP
jgi:hypothetical protein